MIAVPRWERRAALPRSAGPGTVGHSEVNGEARSPGTRAPGALVALHSAIDNYGLPSEERSTDGGVLSAQSITRSKAISSESRIQESDTFSPGPVTLRVKKSPAPSGRRTGNNSAAREVFTSHLNGDSPCQSSSGQLLPESQRPKTVQQRKIAPCCAAVGLARFTRQA